MAELPDRRLHEARPCPEHLGIRQAFDQRELDTPRVEQGTDEVVRGRLHVTEWYARRLLSTSADGVPTTRGSNAPTRSRTDGPSIPPPPPARLPPVPASSPSRRQEPTQAHRRSPDWSPRHGRPAEATFFSSAVNDLLWPTSLSVRSSARLLQRERPSPPG